MASGTKPPIFIEQTLRKQKNALHMGTPLKDRGILTLAGRAVSSIYL